MFQKPALALNAAVHPEVGTGTAEAGEQVGHNFLTERELPESQ